MAVHWLDGADAGWRRLRLRDAPGSSAERIEKTQFERMV
jgi:hypothetical protein